MLFYDFTVGLHFFHIDILGDTASVQTASRGISIAVGKGFETSCIVIRSIEEITIDFVHEAIAKEVKELCIS